nr:CatA-like O-acetyltransferase [Oceanobacillus kimchii]
MDEQLVEWQELVPTFTNFNQEIELFYSLWLEESTDYKSVDLEFKKLIKKVCKHNRYRTNGTCSTQRGEYFINSLVAL